MVQKMTRREIDSLGDYVKSYRAKGLAWLAIEKNSWLLPQIY